MLVARGHAIEYAKGGTTVGAGALDGCVRRFSLLPSFSALTRRFVGCLQLHCRWPLAWWEFLYALKYALSIYAFVPLDLPHCLLYGCGGRNDPQASTGFLGGFVWV